MVADRKADLDDDALRRDTVRLASSSDASAVDEGVDGPAEVTR